MHESGKIVWDAEAAVRCCGAGLDFADAKVVILRQQVSIRLDADVLAKLKATGPGWQTRVNEILRKAVG